MEKITYKVGQIVKQRGSKENRMITRISHGTNTISWISKQGERGACLVSSMNRWRLGFKK